MYFVNEKKIYRLLHLIEENTPLLYRAEGPAFERLAQVMLDACLDVGNLMIDGFIMRDPGSFEDIVDILVDEEVISTEMGASFATMIPYRKLLIQEYLDLDTKQMQNTMRKQIDFFKKFPKRVRHYLAEQLGPVSAFGTTRIGDKL